MTQIASEVFERRPAPHVARGFLHQENIAEFAAGVDACVGLRFAAIHAVALRHAEVDAKLFVEFRVHLACAKKTAPDAHASPRFIRPAIAPVI